MRERPEKIGQREKREQQKKREQHERRKQIGRGGCKMDLISVAVDKLYDAVAIIFNVVVVVAITFIVVVFDTALLTGIFSVIY